MITVPASNELHLSSANTTSSTDTTSCTENQSKQHNDACLWGMLDGKSSQVLAMPDDILCAWLTSLISMNEFSLIEALKSRVPRIHTFTKGRVDRPAADRFYHAYQAEQRRLFIQSELKPIQQIISFIRRDYPSFDMTDLNSISKEIEDSVSKDIDILALERIADKAIAAFQPVINTKYTGSVALGPDRSCHGLTLLHTAVLWGNPKILALILKVPGVNVGLQTILHEGSGIPSLGYCALRMAVERGNKKILALLLKTSLNSIQWALHDAIESRFLPPELRGDIVKELLCSGKVSVDDRYQTIKQLQGRGKVLKVIDQLLTQGMDDNEKKMLAKKIQNNFNDYAFYDEVMSWPSDVLKTFFDEAKVEFSIHQFAIAVSEFLYHPRSQAYKTMLTMVKNKFSNELDEAGDSILLVAARNEYTRREITYKNRVLRETEFIDDLLGIPGLDVNAKAKGAENGQTALMLLVRAGHTLSLKRLLAEPSIDITVKDNTGKTALMHADTYWATNREECVSLLRDAHGKRFVTDALDGIPSKLHHLVEVHGNIRRQEACNYLLSVVANVGENGQKIDLLKKAIEKDAAGNPANAFSAHMHSKSMWERATALTPDVQRIEQMLTTLKAQKKVTHSS